MEYTAAAIQKITKGAAVQGNPQYRIRHMLLDSRKLIYPATTLFIPLVTSRRDGHQFIRELYNRGVRAFMVSEAQNLNDYPEAVFITVGDTLQALQALAAHHRQQFRIPVIGVTGSNGKTVVKEWLYQLLEKDYRIIRSPKSYNSQTGVPLSVWQMEEKHTLAIFEAGISQPGEMAHLEKIIRPTIAIFTNIGQAHNEGFLNIRQKINEKLLLFTKSDILVYCKDYPELNECILQFRHAVGKYPGNSENHLQLFTWSRKTEADLKITNIDKRDGQACIEALFRERAIRICIPFTDEGSIENAIHCWCVLLWSKVEDDIIAQRMMQLSPIAMRLELKQAINNCSLINDSYNSDLGSLVIALDFLQQQKQHAGHTLILSDILQSGRPDAELYEEVAGLLQEKQVTRLIGIGKNIFREKNCFLPIENLDVSFFPSADEFIRQFLQAEQGLRFENETILLKGARIFEFERISRLLEQQVHQTLLEINLNAIAHNLKIYQSILKPGVRTMAMVKAFSYGSGSFEVASLLQFHQVDYLAVAYTDEGAELRRGGVTMPIMVMNPEPGTFDAIIRWRLEPEIYGLHLLRAFQEYLVPLEIREFPIHLKLDTGMHRLGFQENEIDILAEILAGNPFLTVKSVFSHLAASEDPIQEAFTREQARRFDVMSHTLQERIPYPFLRHIANSSAIALYPELQYDMVRLGIGLYGIDHTGILQDQLRSVSTLKTTVSQLKRVAPGETIGYGRMGQVETEKIIATVAVGYADGYLRSLGNGRGSMFIRGNPAPVIGNVCMDMVMLDVTDIPEITEGDEVIVFGETPSLTALASLAGTIPYEIMTGISQRVKRVYFQE